MSGRVVHFEMPDLRYSIVQNGQVSAETGFPSQSGYLGGGMLRLESPTDRQA